MKKKLKGKSRKALVIWGAFSIVLIATLIAERVITIHGMFGLDGRMFFHAWYGFISCVVLVLFSKIIGIFLKRNEGYYKENTDD